MAGRNLEDEVLGNGLWVVNVVEGEKMADLGSSTTCLSKSSMVGSLKRAGRDHGRQSKNRAS